MIGVTLNSYTITKKISEGGMGEIYLAEHKFLERKAAIKVLHKTYSSNKDIRHRFIQEAQTLSKLDHPYIVKIFDFDQYQNLFYIIMEYVEGNTLDEYTRIKNGLMPEHLAKDFFIKVLSAVNYAHNNKIIHRDIKPSNIMISEGNEPKILDFGIARLIDSDRRVTKVNTKMGSILYMSPEQILGKEVDLKSDIYSLGITLYETITARHPYDFEHESDYALQSKILNDYPPPPSAYYPMITKQLEYVISTAINKDPEMRFNSCIEFSEAINDPYYTSDYMYSNDEVFISEVHLNPAGKEVSELIYSNGEENKVDENRINKNLDYKKSDELSKKESTIKYDSKTKVSDSNSKVKIPDVKKYKNVDNKYDFQETLDTENNGSNIRKRRRFYELPAFYFSVLIIVLLGFIFFYYISSDDRSEEKTIIKTKSEKTNDSPNSGNPSLELQNAASEKERIEKEKKEAEKQEKEKKDINKKTKYRNNNNTNYNNTKNNSNPTKKGNTTFE